MILKINIKNIIEIFNVGTNIIVCYNFTTSILYYNNNNSLNKVTDITDSTVFSIQLLCSGLIYETFYYYVILGRKNQLILIHSKKLFIQYLQII